MLIQPAVSDGEPRTVLLAGPRAFCAGVERAIAIVEAALARHGAPVYVRKQIVHNTGVVRDLEARGAVFVDEVHDVPAGAVVVFSAHGVSPMVRELAEDRGLEVVDATCPLVAKVHSETRRALRRGSTVVVIGRRGHDEADGIMGESTDRTVLVQDVTDVALLDVSGPVSYVTQTTLAVDEVAAVVAALQSRFPGIAPPPSEDICYATTNRQNAVRAVAAEAEVVLVVGSGNSHNSANLVRTASKLGRPAYLIDDASRIDPRWLDGITVVGVTAGASASPSLVADVVTFLRTLGAVSVHERTVATETMSFTMPTGARTAYSRENASVDGRQMLTTKAAVPNHPS